ncbi:hypothetical protein M0802_012021 [Mischocyttarus mexicanus]|nr:hypothetical protein M0802_012021 [Mischocyttarus mexicanus]
MSGVFLVLVKETVPDEKALQRLQLRVVCCQRDDQALPTGARRTRIRPLHIPSACADHRCMRAPGLSTGDEDATVKSKKAAGERLARSLSCVGVLIMVCTYSLMSMVYWVVLLGWKGWVTEQSMGETKVKTRPRTNTRILLLEQEIVEYAINGIPDVNLRNQARMNNFRDQESLLLAFENISLSTGFRTKAIEPCNSTNYGGRQVTREKRKLVEVKKPTERGPAMTYEINSGSKHYGLVLDTLLDSGSGVSFIKEELAMGQIDPILESGNKNYGINGSHLQVRVSVQVNLKLDNNERCDTCLLVVPDTTMMSFAVVGPDVLRKCGFSLSRKSSCSEKEVTISQI